MMDLQAFINIGVAITVPSVTGLIVWVWGINSRLHAFEIKVAEEYVKHVHMDDIKATLRRIEDKLDNKVDK